MGSIFRTADAAGIEKIYLCGIAPKPIDEFDRPREQLKKFRSARKNTCRGSIANQQVA